MSAPVGNTMPDSIRKESSVILKQGVRLLGVKPETVAAMIVANSIFQKREVPFVVTSVVDGKHRRGSRHYSGYAFDVRTRNLSQTHAIDVHKEMKDALGDDYDVLLESNHIHIEYDPKTGS